MTSRQLAFDRARTFLTLVVLLHHAVIPYTHYGHTDSTSWIGFDVIILATDSFFMAMFFFLSGLFVWQGLGRKSTPIFLRDRLLRLAVPGSVGALVIVPFAYYALAVQQNPELGFSAFWLKMVAVGPWPSGPIWFIWVLLVFDIMTSVLYRISNTLVFPIHRLSQLGFSQPLRFWLIFILVTAIAYVPMSLHFSNSDWLTFGPFSVQTSRIFLYATYFIFGAGVGAKGFSNGLLSRDGQLPKSRWRWALVALLCYALMWFMVFIKRQVLDNPPLLPWWYQPIFAFLFVLFSASILFAILAFFIHSESRKWRLLDRMHGAAYGMYLLHYPIALWIYYFLFSETWSALEKAATVFILTTVLCWALTAALRKIPGAAHVL